MSGDTSSASSGERKGACRCNCGQSSRSTGAVRVRVCVVCRAAMAARATARDLVAQSTRARAGRGQASRTWHGSSGGASYVPARGGRRSWPTTQGPRTRCACRGGSEDAAGAAARWAANSGARPSHVVTAASSGSVHRYVTCTLFKAAQKLKSDAPNAKPVVQYPTGYLGLSN